MLEYKTGRESSEPLHYKFLIYGGSGAGKTWKVSTAPNPFVVLNEANGEHAVRLSNPDAGYIVTQSLDNIRSVIVSAQNGELKADGFETLVFDGLTEIQRMFKDEILAGKTDQAFSFHDWATLNNKMRNFLRVVRDLEMNVICTALETVEMSGQDEKAQVRHIQPSFEGRKTHNEVMQFFNAVGYAHKTVDRKTGDVEYKVMFDSPSNYSCKSCTPLIGTVSTDVSEWIGRLKESAAPIGKKQKTTKAAKQ